MLKVFVYGTLKPGEAFYEEYCAPYVVVAIPAITQGCLFHLPEGYPAMTLDDAYRDRWVTGALLQFRDETAISHIDEFEDYDPAGSNVDNLYLRLRRPVFSIDRHPLGSA
ncbi:MAG: gamma-glutamylcyclotransferase [Leptolyngbya sp. SIO1D8]|nr:gamma-glutamylcyclotransferase [Leptolyngbya sp. SIO1D8]